MDYEKLHKDTINKLQQMVSCGKITVEVARGICADFIPESEDERIRKEIKDFFSRIMLGQENFLREDYDWNAWMAWLEKKGEQNPKHFELKAGHWYICYRAYCCRADHLTVKEGERFMCEKDGVVKGFVIKEPEKYFKEVCAPAPIDGEQKPADKVEPKFKVGEWITYGDYTWEIVEVRPLDYILQSQDGNVVDDPISYVDGQFHSFTIEDAKDGDILISFCNQPFIYNGKFTEIVVGGYYGLDVDGNFIFIEKSTKDCNWTCNEDIKPATKKQRELLFQKMHEAGYEWDAEKKELKKIEQTSAWSEDDDTYLEHSITAIKNYYTDYKGKENPYRECILDWLKSLKDRVQPQSKQEWSEEDEKKRNLLISILNVNHPNGYFKVNPANTLNMEAMHTEELVSWLKSLRPQNTWKPSDEQMRTLEYYMHTLVCNEHKEILFGLYADLKKLREK